MIADKSTTMDPVHYQNKMPKIQTSNDMKKEGQSRNTTILRSYATHHPGIAMYTTSNLADHECDGHNQPLIDAVVSHEPIACLNNLSFIGVRCRSLLMSTPLSNTDGSGYRYVFVQVDRSRTGIYMSEERFDTIQNLCTVRFNPFEFFL